MICRIFALLNIVVFALVFCQDEPFCGISEIGSEFSDERAFNASGYPTQIRVWHNEYVDA